MLIGIGHQKRHGKSTSSKYLCSKYEFTEFTFATRLKNMIDSLYDIPEYYKYVAKEVNIPSIEKTYRELCERCGQGMRELFGKEFWISLTESDIKNSKKDNCVVSDVRYLNEAEWIKRYGGFLVKIYNPRLPVDNKHISENQLTNYKGWDYIILNDGDKEDLFKKLDVLMGEIIVRSCGIIDMEGK